MVALVAAVALVDGDFVIVIALGFVVALVDNGFVAAVDFDDNFYYVIEEIVVIEEFEVGAEIWTAFDVFVGLIATLEVESGFEVGFEVEVDIGKEDLAVALD